MYSRRSRNKPKVPGPSLELWPRHFLLRYTVNSERNSADTFVSIFAFSLTLCYDFVTIAYANS